jgi:hypothetical protein
MLWEAIERQSLIYRLIRSSGKAVYADALERLTEAAFKD